MNRSSSRKSAPRSTPGPNARTRGHSQTLSGTTVLSRPSRSVTQYVKAGSMQTDDPYSAQLAHNGVLVGFKRPCMNCGHYTVRLNDDGRCVSCEGVSDG